MSHPWWQILKDVPPLVAEVATSPWKSLLGLFYRVIFVLPKCPTQHNVRDLCAFSLQNRIQRVENKIWNFSSAWILRRVSSSIWTPIHNTRKSWTGLQFISLWFRLILCYSRIPEKQHQMTWMSWIQVGISRPYWSLWYSKWTFFFLWPAFNLNPGKRHWNTPGLLPHCINWLYQTFNITEVVQLLRPPPPPDSEFKFVSDLRSSRDALNLIEPMNIFKWIGYTKFI
jgi:hypothetical protein